MTTSTPSSTTTPGSRTPRSSRTSRPTRCSRSGPGRPGTRPARDEGARPHRQRAAYRSRAFNTLLEAQGVKHKYTRPYRSQTNGKAERFNRILLEEWAYVRTYTSGKARIGAPPLVHRDNFHRCSQGEEPLFREVG